MKNCIDDLRRTRVQCHVRHDNRRYIYARVNMYPLGGGCECMTGMRTPKLQGRHRPMPSFASPVTPLARKELGANGFKT
ncbi:hypothetical protein BLA14095_01347 [Burkholderia lata]|nr:hypothetical protein BLA14095_01347 [Burkholderia lata]